ncbi:hypothetical protein APY03_1388 [Variovorax sp. WDL1]|nr:hypothetical protein APY03_1388 [Variovorax sp. WDL1]
MACGLRRTHGRGASLLQYRKKRRLSPHRTNPCLNSPTG